MPNYPIPPWLAPAAAQGYGELAQNASRIALDDQAQKDRLSQQAQQFAVETQQRAQEIAAANDAKQEQLNYEHQLDQQKMQVEQAYKQQQLTLAQQDNQRAQDQWNAKVSDAAQMHVDDQLFQKAMLPKEQGGEGLDAIHAALKYRAKNMTATELGRLSGLVQPPFALPQPQDLEGVPGKKAVETSKGHYQIVDAPLPPVTTVPAALPVADEKGTILGHYAINPVTHKAELIRVQTSSGDDLNQLIQKRQAAKTATQTSTAVDTNTPKAVGGYKIGIVYKGGLRYLGGDPSSEKSWEKVQ